MKNFDYEKALNGDPVCLKNGTPVKIIDFEYNRNSIVFKYNEDGKQILKQCFKNGKLGYTMDHPCILFMKPKIAFMKVYRTEDMKAVGSRIFASKEEAERSDEDIQNCIGLAKVEFID